MQAKKNHITAPFRLVFLMAIIALALPCMSFAQTSYFRINIVDSVTNRGIPGAKLTTTNQAFYITDSNGIIAFDRPDLMGKQVFFSVECAGYTAPADGFGIRGFRFVCTAGGSATGKLTSSNIAERYYRVTGTGIYRDSQLLGLTTPATQDPSGLPVMSQRNGDSILYRNSIFWLGNDTFGPDSPIANLKASCALSSLPLQGGYDPANGVYLRCYRNGQGAKPMIDIGRNVGNDTLRGGSLRTVTDGSNPEKLLANYYDLSSTSSIIERGLLQFDDQSAGFRKIAQFPENATILPNGPTFIHSDAGTSFTYFVSPWPNVRVPRNLGAAANLNVYQAFTCLIPGSRINYSASQMDHDGSGNLRWGWAKNTSPIAETECDQLIQRGLMSEDQRWYKLTDTLTGNRVKSSDSGTVFWNEYRERWISIRTESGGRTPAGEVWYFEGDTPLGPWIYGRKVATHNVDGATSYSFRYTFQHPELDKQGGRIVFFDGMFTNELTPTRFPLPRYNNNRIMYKLDLNDKRLYLPVPVYRINESSITNYRTKVSIPDDIALRTPAFMAPDRRDVSLSPAIVQIYEYPDPAHYTVILSASASSPTGYAGTPVFFGVTSTGALPAGSMLSMAVPLNEFIQTGTGLRKYSTQDTVAEAGFIKQATPISRVWPYPIRFNPYALEQKVGGSNSAGEDWPLFR